MRRRRAEKRQRVPDARYHSTLVTRLVNSILKCGKKSVAERIVYGAIDKIGEKVKEKTPLEMLEQAIENVKPKLETKSRRVGGANYQVPLEVPPERQEALALRWIVHSASSRKGTAMMQALAAEILDAYNNTGTAVKKREDTHKMAQANRAFAHYRW
jgi:small subunit ribosomal protein S7